MRNIDSKDKLELTTTRVIKDKLNKRMKEMKSVIIRNMKAEIGKVDKFERKIDKN